MKKHAIVFLLLVFMLVGCGKFKEESSAILFEGKKRSQQENISKTENLSQLTLNTITLLVKQDFSEQRVLELVLENPKYDSKTDSFMGNFYILLKSGEDDKHVLEKFDLNFYNPFYGDGGGSKNVYRTDFLWPLNPEERFMGFSFFQDEKWSSKNVLMLKLQYINNDEEIENWERMIDFTDNNSRIGLPQ